jgi:hypothetical protein
VTCIALAAALLALQTPPRLPPEHPWTSEGLTATLRDLGEASLPQEADSQPTVRLVIAPAHLTWRVVVVRVTANGSGAEVVTKVLRDRYPGPGVAQKLPTLHVSAQRWADVEGLLGPGLWSFHPRSFPDPLIADGEAWFVETSGRRGYMSLAQLSPAPGAFLSLCQALLRLSSIDYSDQEYICWFGRFGR